MPHTSRCTLLLLVADGVSSINFVVTDLVAVAAPYHHQQRARN